MRNKNRLLIFILIFVIFINFIFIPQKTQAVGASLGAIYGIDVGTKILAFLYACLAVGVTFNSVEEAEAMFDKWLMDNNNWEPPTDGGGNGWKDSLQGVIAGLVGANAIGNLIDSLKDFFQGLGATEGDNILTDNYHYEILETDSFNKSKQFDEVGSTGTWTYSLYGKTRGANATLTSWKRSNGNIAHRLDVVFSNGQHKTWESPETVTMNSPPIINILTSSDYIVVGNGYGSVSLQIPFNTPITNPQEIGNSNISYNVKPNSSVITNIPPTTIPQPDISVVPGIEEQVSPSGEKQNIYPGTMDDLATDLVNNTTWDDIVQSSQSTTTTPYTLTQTQTGVEIDYGEIIDTPFPDVDSSPIESTPEFQGKNIGLLQSIINWLKQLYELPKKLMEIPEETEPQILLDFSPLQGLGFTDKFPFCLPWDLMRSVQLLVDSPTPPIWIAPFVTEEIVIDFTQFEQWASISRIFSTLIFIGGLIVVTRRFVGGA